MAVRNTVAAIPLTSIDSSTFTGAYQVINTNGTPNPCFLLRLINNSNKDVTVSYDGTNDHEFVPANSTSQFPFQSNSVPNNNVALFRQGTKVYVKGSAGTGLVYLAGYYQQSAG